MKKRWAVLILSLLVAGTAVMIYCFSAQSAALSSDTSARVTRWLLQMLKRGFGDLSAREQQALISRYGPFMRKAAHFTEFFLLGLFLRLLLQWLRVRRKTAVSWALGALYAVTDELHQIAVGGRAAMARDVLIDSAGVLCGALLALLCVYLAAKRARPKKEA